MSIFIMYWPRYNIIFERHITGDYKYHLYGDGLPVIPHYFMDYTHEFIELGEL